MSQPSPLRRRPWSQPLADLVAPCLTPSLARFGFDEAALPLFWPDIVGERLASRCEPLRLQWPPRRPGQEAQDAATLIVRVDGAFAIELQHQAPTVIERVNAHAGWRCVGRLAMRQAPRRAAPRGRRPVLPPGRNAVASATAVTQAVADDDLRAALVRLGARVFEGGAKPT